VNDTEPPSLGTFAGHEIYPMPMFATLAVADVAAVCAWYETALGFAVVFKAPDQNGQPPLVHLRRRKYQDLLLVPARSGASAQATLTLSFSADGDLDALVARAQAAPALGASSVAGPVATP
jgi:catechol 2,3-dioxygenase-like lactoylglutathione lyase family enzyme